MERTLIDFRNTVERSEIELNCDPLARRDFRDFFKKSKWWRRKMNFIFGNWIFGSRLDSLNFIFISSFFSLFLLVLCRTLSLKIRFHGDSLRDLLHSGFYFIINKVKAKKKKVYSLKRKICSLEWFHRWSFGLNRNGKKNLKHKL